ncbi:16S rRNA (cytosine(1402)-N(4))-methyltransferase [Candidatus Roizmanbacteria bacterium RIFCSPLOWO2_12_FULL_40_12]|nr:MAG: 16S rRNA (cytosine(1402)-N(4))-methyltransferase [Candidatus Roizmanbacteria bacterium RIFCSPLOWO2_12_FULL_40_12]
MRSKRIVHTPVLLHEVLEGLDLKTEGSYIDATGGEGGHLKEIAKKVKQALGIERNKEQLARIQELELTNVVLEKGNFAEIEKIAKKHGFENIDGILFDLGLSFWELVHLKKGFSYKKDEENLDMTLDETGQEKASDILNKYSKEELYEMFSRNAEEPKSEKIAEEVVRQRREGKFVNVSDLKRAIDSVFGAEDRRVYSRIFQALRMQVNNEKENLEKGLEGAVRILKIGGRLVVISFHSVEDRIVKKIMKKNNMELITKRISRYDDMSFERSATLRVAVKKI